jgi:hypothetical protein
MIHGVKEGGIIAIANADGGVKILPGGALSFSINLKLKV